MADERAATPSSTKLDAWKQLGCMLFEASPEQPLEVLRQRLQEAGAARKDDTGGPQVLIDAGALARAIERYTTQFQQGTDSRMEVMRGLLLTLIGHLESVHTGAGDFAQLAQIRDHLDAACREDLDLVPEMLSRCLSSLKQDFVEKQKAEEVLMAEFCDQVKLLEQSTGTATSLTSGTHRGTTPAVLSDPCTGLPSKAEAEAALRRAAGSPQLYVAVFYVHRMHLVNARFGENVGNEILLFCSQHIATSLVRPSDSLFRWTGPAFVAILERADSPVVVATEVRRLVSAPLSRFFDNSSRTMYLPIKLSAETIPAASQTHAAVVDLVGQFVHHASRTS